MKPRLFALLVVLLLVAVNWIVLSVYTEDRQAGTEFDTKQTPAPKTPTGPEYPEHHANRGATIATFPPAEPDPDWRKVLSPWLAEENPIWSQLFEELAVRDHFRDIKGGFFLDVGCAWPKADSVTNYLEQKLYWSGIGVDVNDAYAPMWAKERPRSEFVCKAIYENDGEELTLYVGMFRSLNKDLSFVWDGETRSKEVKVTTTSINTLLEERGIEKVDFVNIDIEGAEMGALRGFDIQKYRPDLLCIETREYDEVDAFFRERGYERIEKYRKMDKVNVYYRPQTGDAGESVRTMRESEANTPAPAVENTSG